MKYHAAILCAALFSGCIESNENVPAIQSQGLRLSRPEAGQSDRFVGFDFAMTDPPSTYRSYRKDTLTLRIRTVDEVAISMEQEICEESRPPCMTESFRIIRKTGKIEPDSSGYILLTAVNVFPQGIFAENDSKEIGFQGYVPQVDTAMVGFKREHQLGSTKVMIPRPTVLADPAQIPFDGGGFCLIMTDERRILEIYRYMVFGTDGGWELIEH
jgi:hypothetical protein